MLFYVPSPACEFHTERAILVSPGWLNLLRFAPTILRFTERQLSFTQFNAGKPEQSAKFSALSLSKKPTVQLFSSAPSSHAIDFSLYYRCSSEHFYFVFGVVQF